jgi:hypothetical protein
MRQKVKPVRIRAHKAKQAIPVAEAANSTFIALTGKIAVVLIVPLEPEHPANIPYKKTNHRRNEDRNEHSAWLRPRLTQ